MLGLDSTCFRLTTVLCCTYNPVLEHYHSTPQNVLCSLRNQSEHSSHRAGKHLLKTSRLHHYEPTSSLPSGVQDHSESDYQTKPMAQSTAHRRLLQEYRALTNNPPEGITAGPVSEDDLLYWEALIQGPEGTPFEGGVFPAELRFPKDYPLAPPTMKFLGEVWHPNGKLPSKPPPFFSRPKNTNEKQVLIVVMLCTPSIPLRPRLHLDPPPPRRRPEPLRARIRAVVADPIRREDSDLRHEYASRAQRREPRQRGSRQDVAREEGRVRGEGPRGCEEDVGSIRWR